MKTIPLTEGKAIYSEIIERRIYSKERSVIAKHNNRQAEILPRGKRIGREKQKTEGLAAAAGALADLDQEIATIVGAIMEARRKWTIFLLALCFGASALAAQSPERPADPGRARTQVVVSAEWYYFSGGSGLSSDEVIPGFVYTRYKETYPFGGGWALRRTGARALVGFSIGVRYVPMSLALQEGKTVFGTLRLSPWMADLRLDFGFTPPGMAPSDNANGGRIFLGISAGSAASSFANGPFLDDLKASTGVGYSVATKTSFILEGDAGVMILFPPVTLTLFGGYLHVPGGVKTTWTASGPGGALVIEDLDRFTVSSVKLGVSLGLALFSLN